MQLSQYSNTKAFSNFVTTLQLQYTNDFINQNLSSAESTESLLRINSYLSFFLLYCTEQVSKGFLT